MRAYERLIDYAKIWTTSYEDTDKTPSTERQFDLDGYLSALVAECRAAFAGVFRRCGEAFRRVSRIDPGA